MVSLSNHQRDGVPKLYPARIRTCHLNSRLCNPRPIGLSECGNARYVVKQDMTGENVLLRMTNLLEWVLATLLVSVGQPPSDQTQVHYATGFASKGDKHVGGDSPCLGRVPLPTDNIIAHRTLPCGTRVRLTNLRNGRTTVSRVGERGPYGACDVPGWSPVSFFNPPAPNKCPKGKWRIKRRKSGRGVWRGAFDLTPRVRRVLRHNGFELIRLEVLPKKRHRVKRRRTKNHS